MLLKPLTQSLGEGHLFWLTLAMSSTLAGNLTLIGSVANLIVVRQAGRRIDIGFMEYFRVGALITILTVAIGILVLAAEVRIAHGAEAVTAGAVPPPSLVTISPAGGTMDRAFRIVLVRDTPETRTIGLQGFRRLLSSEAALFTFDEPEAVVFWMGQVSYSIDIIFVGPGRRVIRAYRNCKPGARDLYPSGGQAKWVVETAAGSKIGAGDEVKFK
jgi:uncharacterized membrane protein (UPF0127 family)